MMAITKGVSRKTKQQKSSYEILLYKSFNDVSATDWNRFADGHSFFLKSDYISAFEKGAPQNTSFRYALVKVNGEYCCAAYFQLIDVEGDSIANFLQSADIMKYCLVEDKLSKRVECLKLRLLVCGNVFISGEHGYVYDFKSSKENKAFILLNEIIEKVIKQEQSSDPISFVLVKDFYESSVVASNLLKKKRYTGFKVDPNMVLDIHPSWKTFDDYLLSLSSKYRVRAKSILRAGEEVVAKKFTAQDIVLHNDKIMAMYMELHDKAKFKPSSYSINTFSSLKKNLGDSFEFTGYFLGEILVAFKTFFIVDGTNDIEAHFVGVESGANKKHELYQNILYDYAREAIRIKSSKVYYGRTAIEIKSNIGAKPHELVCYIKHVNPVFNFIIKPVIKNLQPKGWIQRNPFKKELVPIS